MQENKFILNARKKMQEKKITFETFPLCIPNYTKPPIL